MDFEITTDGKTVWINTPGVCLGRFSKTGVDVHKTAEDHLETGAGCLQCDQIPNWDRFVAAMEKHHGIDVRPYRPLWAWDATDWARQYAKTRGRSKLRVLLDMGRLPEAHHMAAFRILEHSP